MLRSFGAGVDRADWGDQTREEEVKGWGGSCRQAAPFCCNGVAGWRMRLSLTRAINDREGLVAIKDNELGEPWASALSKEGRCVFSFGSLFGGPSYGHRYLGGGTLSSR
jgi:hypothetical protein